MIGILPLFLHGKFLAIFHEQGFGIETGISQFTGNALDLIYPFLTWDYWFPVTSQNISVSGKEDRRIYQY